jgi:hypothetical protein
MLNACLPKRAIAKVAKDTGTIDMSSIRTGVIKQQPQTGKMANSGLFAR